MKATIGNRNVSKQIAKALEVAAERAGISPSELLELAVPTDGLDADGRLEIEVGDHVAVAAIDGDDVRLTWRAPDGRETATVPAAIADQKAAVARAKEQVKELRKALGLERGRIEDLFTEDREWAVADWRARYLEHPLTGSIGRRLIWTVVCGDARGPTTAMPDGDGFVAADGSAVDIGDDDRIRLWHPIDADRGRHRRLADGAPRAPGPAAVQAGVPRGLRPDARRGGDRGPTRTGSPATSCATRRLGR